MRLAPVLPAWAAVVAALAIPILMDGAVRLLWNGFDLYSIMAGEYRPPDCVRLTLLALPVAIPALVAMVMSAATRVIGRSARLRTCQACTSKNRRWRLLRHLSFPLVAAAVACVFYLLRIGEMEEQRWGVLFAPWVAWVILAEHSSWFGGARWQRASATTIAVHGARALSAALSEQNPELLEVGRLPRVMPAWQILAGWAVAVGMAFYVVTRPPLEGLVQPCPLGTWPLSYRSGVARIVGCHAADGSRHGHVTGGVGGWNTSSRTAFEGGWFFGDPDGAFRFADGNGVTRAQGTFRRSHPTGRWVLSDDKGALLEETDADTGRILRPHPHLQCPEGSVMHLGGSPLFGQRECRRGGTASGPYVRVADGLVVETGNVAPK